jgi:hypothetical protein
LAYYDKNMPHLNQAQICENGHVVTDNVNLEPHLAERFCSKCGAATIVKCAECGTPIRGSETVETGFVYNASSYKIAMGAKPLYCPDCGKPYPWMMKASAALDEVLREAPDVEDAEREKAASDLRDVAQESPRTPAAVARLTKLLKKLGPDLAEATRKIIVDVAAETVKKTLGM